ncbi:MAG: hypothetical protein AAGD10_09805 [Myxococcota bacterium]
MKIEVRSSNKAIDHMTAQVVLNQTARGLHDFSHRLGRVVVGLRRLEEARSGRSIQCVIQLHQEKGPVILVKELEKDPIRAVSTAIAKCQALIARRRRRAAPETVVQPLVGAGPHLQAL